MTTLSLTRLATTRFGASVFHVSDVKREVWKINPKAVDGTIRTALHFLVRRHKELESPRYGHYRRKNMNLRIEINFPLELTLKGEADYLRIIAQEIAAQKEHGMTEGFVEIRGVHVATWSAVV